MAGMSRSAPGAPPPDPGSGDRTEPGAAPTPSRHVAETDNPNRRFGGVTTPPVVEELAAGRSVGIVWRDEIGGVTFSIGDGAEYVKHGPGHAEFDPDAELDRLR